MAKEDEGEVEEVTTKTVKKKKSSGESKKKNSSKKKSAKKKSTSKKSSQSKKQKENEEIQEQLIQNFVSLQNIMANMSSKFDDLTNKISKMLELFEASAESLSKNEIKMPKQVDEDKIMKRLEELADQNKTIARGVTLTHERLEAEENKNKKPSPGPKKQTISSPQTPSPAGPPANNQSRATAGPPPSPDSGPLANEPVSQDQSPFEEQPANANPGPQSPPPQQPPQTEGPVNDQGNEQYKKSQFQDF